MSMSELERARQLSECVRFYEDSRCRIPGGFNPADYYFADRSKLAIFCRDRVAELEAAEKEASEPSTVVQTARHVRYLKEALADLQNDLQRVNIRIERVERKAEEDNGRTNHISAEIQRVRHWCVKHKHYSDACTGSERTSVPCDVTTL